MTKKWPPTELPDDVTAGFREFEARAAKQAEEEWIEKQKKRFVANAIGSGIVGSVEELEELLLRHIEKEEK